ncbi:ATP-binding protein [Undibacterium sp. Di27W]|uniref:ATP-binding protein n=1 Tax=Undibacterium sp. Di27W TaxID=3413036 RepID=UPI003BF36131
MKTQAIAFRARARTIDHLGKGQIADCPTAISELWKNSFDAYARDVALHLFDGDTKCGSIIDNGCGMTFQQLIESWLIVGTESKSKKKSLDSIDRFGLPIRSTQGEKGIGRLSCAFLAPVTLLVTKKIDTQFSIALIDWRLFENTYLSLSDISVPVSEIEDLIDLPRKFEQLLRDLKSNLSLNPVTLDQRRIRQAWEQFGEDQIEAGENSGLKVVTTEQRICAFCDSFDFDPSILDSWEILLDKAKKLDGAAHGTALLLLDLDRELALCTNRGNLDKNNHEIIQIEKDLVDTLRAFVDPFSQDLEEFEYEIRVFSENSQRQLLRQSDVFDLKDFLNLEHVVQGEIDSRGWFIGKIKAFGIDRGEFKFSPSIELDRNGTKVGPFKLSIGTFEQELDKTSHSENIHANLIEQTDKQITGLMIYRDGLRVLPYGRVDNDFFEIEERRSKSAGRYYWSKRRIFGQVLITQNENSQLKDKAGREGFIKNQAARELKALVSEILVQLADRFFGARSDDRQKMLEIVKIERESRKAAQTQARKQSQKQFLLELKRLEPELTFQLNAIRNLRKKIENLQGIENSTLAEIDDNFRQFESNRTMLKTPVKPPKIGDNENRYRLYRDMYSEYTAHILDLKNKLNKFESQLYKQSPLQSAKKHFDRNQSLLNAQINKAESKIESKLSSLKNAWGDEARQNRSEYYKFCIQYVENVQNGFSLEDALNNLDATYNSFADTFSVKYDSMLRALERLEEGVNLDAAFSMAEEEKAYFEDKAKSLQALAQLGISVEILAHELEELDGMVTAGLNSLPKDIKETHPGYRTAYNAHKSLTQQIRFLSPLKLSGYQIRTVITGKEIQRQIEMFFKDRFSRQRVEMRFEDTFLRMSIKDLPSRIYPVFVNLINNALYWVCLSEYRLIKIDVVENEVVIANSGPPVDEDDIPRLFELFYSRRSNGHGVGLYLCKENLAVAHHKIRYGARDDIQLIEDGANFIITFNGMEIE